MRIKWAVPLLCILLLAGCANMGGKTSIDQAIQYRSIFNSTLSSFSTNLAAMPQPAQQKYAAQALPFARSGVLALDTMDAMVAGGGTLPVESVQQYLIAKNALIDLIAKMILEKGGK
jgi:hypothetical protein